MRHAENKIQTPTPESINHAQEKKKAIETYRCPEVRFNKDLKVAIINILKELKETMLTDIKEGMMTMSHQLENIIKKTEIAN